MATEDDLEKTARQVHAAGRRVLAVRADVTSAEALDRFARATVRELGRIDYVIANAGIWSIGGPTWTIDEATFDETIAVDLKGAWLTCKYTVPHLLERGSGSIVLTSSGAATTVNANISHYTAAKAGLLGLMRCLAAELAPHGIRANALLPLTFWRSKMKRVVLLSLTALAITLVALPSLAKDATKAKMGNSQYMVIAPHTPEQCLKALDDVSTAGSLGKWNFGCMDNDHTGYLIVSAAARAAPAPTMIIHDGSSLDSGAEGGDFRQPRIHVFGVRNNRTPLLEHPLRFLVV